MTERDFSPAHAPILVASDSIADAELVATLLGDEFARVQLSVKPENAVADFDAHRPLVLILAFDTLEAAQDYTAGLYRLSKVAHSTPHRTLILCSKTHLWRVYELCRKEHYDDYVLFWPVTNDAPRLPMAVHHALRRMKATLLESVTANQLAASAAPLANLESELTQYMSQIEQRIDVAGLTVSEAQQLLDGAVDERRIGTIRKHFHSIADLIGGLQQASSEAGRIIGARFAPVRRMLEMAKKVRPVVLVVDDDEFQQKLVAHALRGYHVELIFASSAAEITGLLWQYRPNVVLMDIELPGIDGVEATRQIRNIANFSDMQIIMVTGHSERAIVVESLKAGAVDFLVKPLDRAKLIEKLSAFVPMDALPSAAGTADSPAQSR